MADPSQNIDGIDSIITLAAKQREDQELWETNY
jgi:hypothetical protein